LKAIEKPVHQMTQQLRERINKREYMKLKTSAHRMVTRLKRQSTEWEKIFASYTSHEGLITRIDKELEKLMTR
jgi:hypothetical protein